MRAPLPPLPSVHAFEAAARLQSFAAAGEELHVSPATISQRVRTLESHLGVRLFERLARSVQLTEFGRAYQPAVRESLDDLAAATSGLFGAVRREQLTVRTQISYATTWLAPRIHDFQQAHPAVDLRIVCAVWSEALTPGEVDIDIHQGRGPWAGVDSELLHHDNAVVIRGAAHNARHGPITSLADLTTRPRVHVLGFDDVWQRILPDGSLPPERAITVDTSIAALEIAASDDVCAVIPERFARTAARNGRISLALAGSWPMRQAHYVLRSHDAPPPTSAARAFLRWLTDLEQHSTPLGGAVG